MEDSGFHHYLENPDELLSRLIRFNTVNPPGNEAALIGFVRGLLEEAGIESREYTRSPGRPNLWATLPAQKPVTAPPLLLYGHVDTVPVTGQDWTVDPFGGVIREGYVWGRGAMDMKGEAAMFLCAMLSLREAPLPFAVHLLLVSDEEGHGDDGMGYMAAQHPELFRDIRWAFGEIGGFSMTMGDKRLYPIMIGEKQIAHIRVTARGTAGHASMAGGDGAVSRLARAMTALSRKKLPVCVTPEVAFMVRSMAKALGGAAGAALPLLLKKPLTGLMLRLLGENGSLFSPLLRNTVTVTMLQGGTAVNVVPSEVSFDADLRILPGQEIRQALDEIQAIIGPGCEITVVRHDANTQRADLTLFDALADALRAKDPEALPVPFVLAAVTDARLLGPTGVMTYGFTPMRLPADYAFAAMAHAADERIPAGAVAYGAEVITEFISSRYEAAAKGGPV